MCLIPISSIVYFKANDVFAVTERPIPVLPLVSFSSNPLSNHIRPSNTASSHARCHNHLGWKDAETTNHAAGLSQESLLDAVVVQQVDRKFIACLIAVPAQGSVSPFNPSRILFLIDQHAADERVRVERFLRELCIGFLDCVGGGVGVEKRRLDDSVPVLVSGKDARHMGIGAKESFRRWGFDVHKRGEEGDDEGEYVQLWIESVPEVVADKVYLELDLSLPTF